MENKLVRFYIVFLGIMMGLFSFENKLGNREIKRPKEEVRQRPVRPSFASSNLC